MKKIAIIGLGYVGLPLALQFSRSGVSVVGLDVDETKVTSILEGKSYIRHIEHQDLEKALKENTLTASSDFSVIGDCEAVIICVPTPLNKHREPDISYVLETGKAIAPHLVKTDKLEEVTTRAKVAAVASSPDSRDGSGPSDNGKPAASSSADYTGRTWRRKLVVLESTTYPGTTDEDLRKVLEDGSGLAAGKDFHLAFSPEREDPGNPQSVVKSIPKVVGGYTPECLKRAEELYGYALDTLISVSSCRAAEATKLLENIFRSVNIALVNELKVIYEAMNIDIWEVVNAAKTKPFGFMPFYPGPGLGGHCIPIDPFYLTWKAREYGQHTRFIELAGEINTSMPRYVVNKVAEALNDQAKPLRGSRVLVIGLAYKPDVDDDRESPSYTLMDLMTARGAEVSYYDPHVPVIKPTREHSHWQGVRSIDWDQEEIASYDCIVIATAHSSIDFAQLAKWATCILDTRNAMAKAGIEGKNVIKA